ncbi:MAG: MFS transporter [Blastomonas sp.]
MNAPPAPSPFAIRLYRSLWTANLVSSMGFMIQSVGASWLMTMLSPSPRMVALVQTSTTLPITLLALFAGAVADNLDRRRVMITAQSFMLAMSFFLAITAWLGMLNPALLLCFTFMIGCGTAMHNPAWQASIGDIVPKPVLPAAVAYNSIAFNVARSAGPAIGGTIVAAAGAAIAFMINCISYIGLIAVLVRWKPERSGHQLPPERIGSAIASGLRYVAMSPNLLRVAFRGVLFGASTSAVMALMPVVARDLLQGGAVTYGLLLCGFGIGAVGGALISARSRRRFSIDLVLAMASISIAIGATIVALSSHIALTMPALALCGGGWILGMSNLNVTVQLATPRWVVARAISLYQMSAFGGMAMGSWMFGTLAARHSIPEALFVCAALQVAIVLIGLVIRLPRVDDLNMDLSQQWSEPETEVPVEARSGPVAITIHYQIDDEDIPVFLAEMSEWRRLRRRDGARRWTLYRDLADPRIWIERYQVPTWLDYMRHNTRRTHEDAERFRRIHALHRGEGRPPVQRMIVVDPRSGGQLVDREQDIPASPIDEHH